MFDVMMCCPSQTITGDWEISERAILKFSLKIRKFMENLHTLMDLIGGLNEAVSLISTVITKGKYNWGRLIPPQWVVWGDLP